MVCKHNKNPMEILSPCCGKWYPCRICHDEIEQHEMHRFLLRKVRCTLCQRIQRPGKVCEGCGAVIAVYHCEKCNAFSDYSEHSHCDGCGICRPGFEGVDREHCDGCGICVQIGFDHGSNCKKRAIANERCAICMDGIPLRSSFYPLSQISNCGHLFHQSCLAQWSQKSSTCPICRCRM